MIVVKKDLRLVLLEEVKDFVGSVLLLSSMTSDLLLGVVLLKQGRLGWALRFLMAVVWETPPRKLQG